MGNSLISSQFGIVQQSSHLPKKAKTANQALSMIGRRFEILCDLLKSKQNHTDCKKLFQIPAPNSVICVHCVFLSEISKAWRSNRLRFIVTLGPTEDLERKRFKRDGDL
jgi:hypothetical protein